MSAPESRAAGTETVDFGAERIPASEKRERVGEVFRQVASRYDVMNDIMSFGTHRLMKRAVVDFAAVRAGDTVLDLAGGTGDMAARFAPRVGKSGRVVLADVNPAMLRIGRDRVLDEGHANVLPLLADAEQLPLPDASFDAVVIAFGLRNVTRKHIALEEMLRILKPGGRALVLEFSHPTNPWLARGYRAFSGLWPTLGRAVVGDAAPYRYLVESIEKHPPQATLALMMTDAGFEDVGHVDFLGGIAALHYGSKAAPG